MFPSNPYESIDSDSDGTGDASDPDIDGDGILNADDEQPFEINYGSQKYPHILELNQSQSGSVKAQKWQYYKVESAPDTMLNITLSYLSDDVDLYVSEGGIPERYSYECRSNESGFTKETCLLRVDLSTTYYIAVFARENTDFTILAKNQEVEKKKVVLLLHGLASEPSTWNAVVNDDSFFNGSCSEYYYSYYSSLAVPEANKDGIYCFNLEFGSLDRSLIYSATGLDQKVCNRALGCNGDYTTFEGLAIEVENAVIKIISVMGYDTEIFLFGHSRGGLAGRAYLQSDTAYYREFVSGIATTGTPHQGSPLGRIYKYMQDNCTPKITYRQDGSKCEDNWETIEMLAGERTFFGYNYQKEYQMDMHAPSIDYLSPESTAISSLNVNISALYGKVLGSLSYEGTSFGFLARGAGVSTFYDIYDYGTWFSGDHPHPSLLTYVENGQTRDSYYGDGIVPAYSQRFYILLSEAYIFGSINANNFQKNNLHTDETSLVSDINWLFENLYPVLGWKE